MLRPAVGYQRRLVTASLHGEHFHPLVLCKLLNLFVKDGGRRIAPGSRIRNFWNFVNDPLYGCFAAEKSVHVRFIFFTCGNFKLDGMRLRVRRIFNIYAI